MVDRPTAAQDASHPKTGDCAQCHTSTTSFTQGVSTKPANHIPTSQPCTLCHSNANDYSVYAMNHQGIANGCIACHGAGLSFANIVPKEPPSNHIPTASIACEGCHSITNFTNFSGTAMNHTPVAALTCVTCHETGMSWFGVKMVDRPKGHHTGQDCKGCHNTNRFDGGSSGNAVRRGVNAQPAVTAAGSTAGRAAAVGAAIVGSAAARSATLPTAPTTTESRSSAPASPPSFNLSGSLGRMAARSGVVGATRKFDHSTVQRNCASCHNGLIAEGKGVRHIVTASSCGDCHTTIAWIPARVDHRSVTQPCASCHDSLHAVGKPATHLQTQLSCNNCHTTLAWLPVVFRHSTISGACRSCHNGIGAGGKPLQHMLSTLDCAACHSTVAWTPAQYRHTSPRYPANRRGDLNCKSCHKSNTEHVSWMNSGPQHAVSAGGS
jgi:hypothetical protein